MGSETIKVEVIHKEIIKPSSPTPHHLRTTSLSIFDQFQPEIYLPLLIFYPGNTSNDANIDRNSLFAQRCNLLKTSLSQALTHYYPFAGELLRKTSIILCNDHGAAFLEAQVNCPMSKVLDNPDFRILEQMAPTKGNSTLSDTSYLLLFQVNLFECGGLAIAVSLLHKVADVDTFNTFLKSWTAISLRLLSTTTADHVVVPAPKFGVAASLFPPEDFFNSSQFSLPLPMENCITRKFVFDASKIAALKSKAASTTVTNPSRVEVVSALIWKCLIQASRSNSSVIKPSVWCPMVNMRQRPGKGFGEHILGNFVWVCAAIAMEREVEYESLVAKLRKGIQEYKEKYANGVTSEHILQSFKQSGKQGNFESYTSSSWCRLSFYEADFGWGKPLWVTARSAVKNTIILMDMKDGVGLEASLTLEKEDMSLIESNEELLAYASPIQLSFN